MPAHEMAWQGPGRPSLDSLIVAVHSALLHLQREEPRVLGDQAADGPGLGSGDLLAGFALDRLWQVATSAPLFALAHARASRRLPLFGRLALDGLDGLAQGDGLCRQQVLAAGVLIPFGDQERKGAGKVRADNGLARPRITWGLPPVVKSPTHATAKTTALTITPPSMPRPAPALAVRFALTWTAAGPVRALVLKSGGSTTSTRVERRRDRTRPNAPGCPKDVKPDRRVRW